MLFNFLDIQKEITDLLEKGWETDRRIVEFCERLNHLIQDHEKQLTIIQNKVFPIKRKTNNWFLGPVFAAILVVLLGKAWYNNKEEQTR